MTSFFSNPVNGMLVAIFLLTLMILVVQLAHADIEEMWLQIIAPHPHIPEAYGEVFFIFPVTINDSTVNVYITTNPEEDCNHMKARGCLHDIGIILIDPFIYDSKGCTLLAHELYHWIGYSESELPDCPTSQEFRR